MHRLFNDSRFAARLCVLLVSSMLQAGTALASESERIDYLSIAQGAIPVAFEGPVKALRVGISQALLAIDGDPGVFVLTPKPGGADSRVAIVYKLPALTRFTEFVVPAVLETPSPFQTFVRTIEIAGSTSGPQGPFVVLASQELSTHKARGQLTNIPASGQAPVRWLRVAFAGGIDVQRDKTFFEFSEIIGHGSQQPVPLVQDFNGKWKGRGVLLELKQDGVRVTGCYDGEGDLSGTVSGNLLRAIGKHRKTGVPSSFVLALGEQGEVVGVRSSNRAPFRLYTGASAPKIRTECSAKAVQPLGCGAVIHGINFDFDSASIRPESTPLLDALAVGLKASDAAAISVIGHTSSEGAEAYNKALSQRRAQSVVAAIVERGIDPGRIGAQGRGEQQPIADNSTDAGRSLNRRVEITCP